MGPIPLGASPAWTPTCLECATPRGSDGYKCAPGAAYVPSPCTHASARTHKHKHTNTICKLLSTTHAAQMVTNMLPVQRTCLPMHSRKRAHIHSNTTIQRAAQFLQVCS